MSSGGDKRVVSSDINVTPLIDVLLVLLVIFLVVLPVMTKVEPLTVPRKLDEAVLEYTDQTQLVLTVRNDLSVGFNDGSSEIDVSIAGVDVARTLRPRLAAWASTTPKVVFVDFEEEVPWAEVVATMDSVRSLAADANHDEISVALKVREAP